MSQDVLWDAWLRMDNDERLRCVGFAAGVDPEAFARVVKGWLGSDARARYVAAGRTNEGDA